MFGRKKLPFGMPDYMTPGGGIGGGLPGMPGAGLDTSIAEDPYAAERPAEKPGFFGKGRGLRDAVGYGLGALAQQFGGSNPYDAKIKDDRELRQAVAVARIKADSRDNDTPAMREAAAMGFQPGTPEFNSYVRRARMKPSFMMMGNPEIGQQIVDPEAMGGASIQPGHVEDGHVFMGGDPGDPNNWRQQ